MTASKNMIENRIAAIEEWGKDGKLNGELFMYSLGEYGFLKELAEIESKEAGIADQALTKLARETRTQGNQITKALRMANKLANAIEDMKYDCDGEVYQAIVKIIDVLAE